MTTKAKKLGEQSAIGGLNLRQYLAASALKGIAAKEYNNYDLPVVAKSAVALADALLEELSIEVTELHAVCDCGVKFKLTGEEVHFGKNGYQLCPECQVKAQKSCEWWNDDE